MGRYDDLLYYAQAYLQFAQLGCQELLAPHHNRTDHIPDWKMSYSVQIAGPIIYNTKHGIECFLKVLQKIADQDYDTIHHLHDLFTAVRAILEGTEWKPVSDNGDEIDQDEIDNLPNVLKEVEDTVTYFYINKILDEKMGTGEIPDPSNQLFRYPEMRDGTTFDYKDFLATLEEADIEELKQKIINLYDNLNNLGYFLAVSLQKP